MTAIK